MSIEAINAAIAASRNAESELKSTMRDPVDFVEADIAGHQWHDNRNEYRFRDALEVAVEAIAYAAGPTRDCKPPMLREALTRIAAILAGNASAGDTP